MIRKQVLPKQTQALVLIRYVHARALAELVVRPQEASHPPPVADMGLVMNTAIKIRSISQKVGDPCKDFNDVLDALRKGPSRAPAPLVRKLKSLGAAADFCRHSSPEELKTLVNDLGQFLSLQDMSPSRRDGTQAAEEPQEIDDKPQEVDGEDKHHAAGGTSCRRTAS